jgi:hypothetical protein
LIQGLRNVFFSNLSVGTKYLIEPKTTFFEKLESSKGGYVMALTICPECGHEVSTAATACPNCGRPLIEPAPVIERNVVVAEAARDEGFPKWLLVPIVALGAVAIFLLFALVRSSDDNDNSKNINVNIAQRKSAETRDTPGRTESAPNQVDIPSTTVSTPAAVPQTVPPQTQTDVAPVAADRGVVVIDAKVTTRTGTTQAVKNEKFYLLDEDLESILSDADLEPINGETLTNSFGLSVLYPERYGNFNRDALNAIKKHIKYDVLTDGSGKARIKDVRPDSYYLFGITKTRSGFAIWNSPVSIQGGENILNLSPARLNEFSE